MRKEIKIGFFEALLYVKVSSRSLSGELIKITLFYLIIYYYVIATPATCHTPDGLCRSSPRSGDETVRRINPRTNTDPESNVSSISVQM